MSSAFDTAMSGDEADHEYGEYLRLTGHLKKVHGLTNSHAELQFQGYSQDLAGAIKMHELLHEDKEDERDWNHSAEAAE